MPDTARLILWSVALTMIAWTVTARLTLGQQWTTSVLLRRLFATDPILGNLLQVFAALLFVAIVPDWGLWDVLLAFIVFEGLGHICWPL